MLPTLAPTHSDDTLLPGAALKALEMLLLTSCFPFRFPDLGDDSLRFHKTSSPYHPAIEEVESKRG